MFSNFWFFLISNNTKFLKNLIKRGMISLIENERSLVEQLNSSSHSYILWYNIINE